MYRFGRAVTVPVVLILLLVSCAAPPPPGAGLPPLPPGAASLPPPNLQIVAPKAPPPIQFEPVDPAPKSQVDYFAWDPGHWHWTGSDWFWIRGHYVEKPYTGSYWVKGHWDQRPYGWTWIPGYWSLS